MFGDNTKKVDVLEIYPTDQAEADCSHRAKRSHSLAFCHSSRSRASRYNPSSSTRNFFAVWGRLSFNLQATHRLVLVDPTGAILQKGERGAVGGGTYVGVNSSFSIVNGSTNNRQFCTRS